MDVKILKIMQKGSSIIVRGNVTEVNEKLKMIGQEFKTNQINEGLVEITKITKRSKMNISETIESKLKNWSGYKQYTGNDILFTGSEITVRCIVSKFNKMNNDIFKVKKLEDGSFKIHKDVNKIIAKESITEDEYTLYNLQRLDENKLMMAKVVRREIIPVAHEVDVKHEAPEYQVDDEPTMEDDPEDFDGSPVLFYDDDDDEFTDEAAEDYINMMDQIID